MSGREGHDCRQGLRPNPTQLPSALQTSPRPFCFFAAHAHVWECMQQLHGWPRGCRDVWRLCNPPNAVVYEKRPKTNPCPVSRASCSIWRGLEAPPRTPHTFMLCGPWSPFPKPPPPPQGLLPPFAAAYRLATLQRTLCSTEWRCLPLCLCPTLQILCREIKSKTI